MGAEVLRGDGPETAKLISNLQHLIKDAAHPKKKHSKSKRHPIEKQLTVFRKPKSKKPFNLVQQQKSLLNRKKSMKSPKFNSKAQESSLMIDFRSPKANKTRAACVQFQQSGLRSPDKQNRTPLKFTKTPSKQEYSGINSNRLIDQQESLHHKYSKIDEIIKRQKQSKQYSSNDLMILDVKDRIVAALRSSPQNDGIIEALESPSVMEGVSRAIAQGISQRNSYMQLNVTKINSQREPTITEGAETFRERRRSEIERKQVEDEIRCMARQLSKQLY